MVLGRVWSFVRPASVKALPVCVLRRTCGRRIRVGPGMGWRVISGIPEGPGAISSSPTATKTTLIQTKLVKELKFSGNASKEKNTSFSQSATFNWVLFFSALWNLKILYLMSDDWNKKKYIYKVLFWETFKSTLPWKICFPVWVPSQRHKNDGSSINLFLNML